MADGNVTQTFEKIMDGNNLTGYSSSVIENGTKTIRTYNKDFEVVTTSVITLFDNLKSLEKMAEDFQSAWVGINAGALFGTNNARFFKRDEIIFVVEEGGEDVLGRINYWGNEHEWIDWEGRAVVNAHYAYNFHDGDWNYFGSSGGYNRTVKFEVEDRRWDNGEVDEPFSVLDETGTYVNYRVEKSTLSVDDWEDLDPGLTLMDSLDRSWGDVDFIEIGSNTWTQLDTGGATRDSEYSNTGSNIRLYVAMENTGHQYIGQIDYTTDGFIEVRDEQWNLILRTVDPSDPNLLSWDVVTSRFDGLKEAWDAVGVYLPLALRNDITTREKDERADLRFKVDQWDNLLVFSKVNEIYVLAARINTWEHQHSWQSNYSDGKTNTSGYTYNTGTTYNFNDENWNELARSGSEQHYFVSDEVIKAKFSDARPENFAELQAGLGDDWAGVAILTYGSTSSGQVLRKEDLGSIWDDYVQQEHGVPDVALYAKGIWLWEDVSYIVVQQNEFESYDLQGTATNSRTEERIEYHAEGFWSDDGKFTPWSRYNQVDHGIDKNALSHMRQMLGVIEERDGFIEIRDAQWKVIGRFADPSQATAFELFAPGYEGLEEAWSAVASYLPSTWDLDTLLFSVDSNQNILVMDDTGVFVGRINYWGNESNGNTLSKYTSYNFNTDDWQSLVYFSRYEEYTGEVLQYSDQRVEYRVEVETLDDGDDTYSPIPNEADLTLDFVSEIWVANFTQSRFDKFGEPESTYSGSTFSYFSKNEFLGAQEEFSGVVTLYGKTWEVLATEYNGELTELSFLGENTHDILENWIVAFKAKMVAILDLGSEDTFSFGETADGAVVLFINDEIVEVGVVEVEDVNQDMQVHWRINFDGAIVGGWNRAMVDSDILDLEEHGVRFKIDVLPDEDLTLYSDLISEFSPPSNAKLEGTIAEGFDFEKPFQVGFNVRYDNWEGIGPYHVSEEVRFIPSNMGQPDFENRLVVKFENDAYELLDTNWNPIGVTWLDPDVSMRLPDFLGDNTEAILDNWFAIHGEYLLSLSGDEGNYTIKQLSENTAVALIGDEVIATGDIEVQLPNESGEKYWFIDFDGVGIGGWNRVTDQGGVLSLTENGVQIYLDVSPSDDSEWFAALIEQYTPPSTLDLQGTIIQNFQFAAVPQIAFEIWQNDFNGDGYTKASRVKFLPDNGFGGADRDNAITVSLEESIFEVFDTDWNSAGVVWLDLDSTKLKLASYSHFLGHADLLDNLLGESNVFTNSVYSTYGSNFVAVDVDDDEATDVFVTNVVNDGEWQEIRDPDTLKVIGGLFKASGYDFARLPSSEEKIASWALDFFEQLDVQNVVDEYGKDEADTLRLMSKAISNIFDPERLIAQLLDAQVHVYKGLDEDERAWESVGFRVMDEGEALDIVWVNREDQGDRFEYSVSIRDASADGELRILANSDIYAAAYSDLISAIEI
jgi:hypothetical protein